MTAGRRIIWFLGLAVVACAAPRFQYLQDDFEKVKTSYFYSRPSVDVYFLHLTQSDGIRRYEEGDLKDDPSGVSHFVSGFYSWTGPDNVTYWVDYEADENGYRAKTKIVPPQKQLNIELSVKEISVPLYVVSSLLGG